MSSTYRSSRTAFKIVNRTSRSRSLGPALRKQVLATRRETSTVAEAAATARQANCPPPAVSNVPAQELWKGKEVTGLQDTLKHAYERELGVPASYIHLRRCSRWSIKALMAIRGLLVPKDARYLGVRSAAGPLRLSCACHDYRNRVRAC